MAQTEEMMESVWIAVQALLGDGLTPLQDLVLKLRLEKREATKCIDAV